VSEDPPGQCVSCGAALAPRQRWCLGCGTGMLTRIAATPRWGYTAAVALLIGALALAGVGYALATLLSS
jgi:predicted RNA-binding Zn-ribbon protein involved in translation (DUF1610 family)